VEFLRGFLAVAPFLTLWDYWGVDLGWREFGVVERAALSSFYWNEESPDVAGSLVERSGDLLKSFYFFALLFVADLGPLSSVVYEIVSYSFCLLCLLCLLAPFLV